MKITKLKLRNFRCFGSTETIIPLEDITVFVGANSAGKTTVLHALLKLFGNNLMSRTLARSDFHIPQGQSPETIVEQSLYIEAIIEFPELDDVRDKGINTVPNLFAGMTINAGPNRKPYIRIRLEATWHKSNYPDGDIEQKLLFIIVPEGENDTLDICRKPCHPSYLSFIYITYVPAIRHPSEQLKTTSTAILGRILKGIRWPEDINKQVKSSSSAVENVVGRVKGFQKLQEVMGVQWRGLHSDTRYSQIKVKISSEDIETIFKKLEIRFSPTPEARDYDVDNLGEGLRSVFYLSMVTSLLEIEALANKERLASLNVMPQTETDPQPDLLFTEDFIPPHLSILAVEEPENHVAPHLLGRIVDNLNNASRQSNVQVLLTSHTPAIVRRVDPRSIRHLRICKQSESTILSIIKLPDEKDVAFKYVKEAVKAYSEIYFSRLVILGEGDTEEIVIPRALQMLGTSLDGGSVSVVPLGGRFVNHFWKLLSDIGIPFITILDLDLERGGGGWARVKYAIKQLLARNIDETTLLNDIRTVESAFDTKKLEQMHERIVDRPKIMEFVKVLEKYKVFFASPLDMDFLMLSAYEEQYKSLGLEPQVDAVKAIENTLKSNGATAQSYSEKEKDLMRWYNYLFLNRGKPSTHFLALSTMSDTEFSTNLPQVIKLILDATKNELSDDPFSQVL